ncbi:EAL domain-containing protein, partial [Neglectibacter timonensis]
PKQDALLKSIVKMAAINGLSVVAEGVETRAEQQAIAKSCVHYIQGYFYARPMPEEELRRFLSP